MPLTQPSSSVAASSPNSLGSDAMDESDSDRDDDPPPRDSDVPYPLEGKYLDSRDKAKILAMSQLEREEILGQRAEEMSSANFQAEVARRAAANMRKRKADSEEPEESQRKSSRQVKPKTTSGLEAYKRDREQRGQQRQIRDDREDDRRNGRRRSSSADRNHRSDVDAEGESDVDWDEDRKPVVREEQPASLTHFESVRVGRGFFSMVCFYPGFDQAMTGAFGRIGVGQDAQRRTLYKMAQIKGMFIIDSQYQSQLTVTRLHNRQTLRLRG
jgi:RNA polymerase-associated protein RTF1